MRGLVLVGLALVVATPLAAQERTRSPHGALKMECMSCHVSTGWTPVRVAKTFDHSKFGFTLGGAHGAANCRACHQALDFKGVKSDCVSCHTDRHRGELGANCARCHTARSFLDRDLMTKAHQLSRFPLQGGHLGVDCSSCHKSGAQGSMQFVGTQSECVVCHKADFNTAPNHVASSFPTGCVGCHNQVAWNRVGGLGGAHPSVPLALTGVHANRQCTDCHLAGQAHAAVKQTCDGCHHSDFVAAKDPDHVAAPFSTSCTTCHALVAGWTGATYATHSTAPINPKQGAHGAVTCTQCHTRAPYSSAPTTCDACHHTDYVATTRSEPYVRRVLDQLRHLPPGGGWLGRGHRQSSNHPDRADWGARQPAVHRLPSGGPGVYRRAADLRRLSPQRLCRRQGPGPRGGGVLAKLHYVPRARGGVDRRHVCHASHRADQSQAGSAWRGDLHTVSYQVPLLERADNLRRVSPRRLRRDQQSEPHGRRLFDQLRLVPPGGGWLGRGQRQSPDHPACADRAARDTTPDLRRLSHDHDVLQCGTDLRRVSSRRLRGRDRPEPHGGRHGGLRRGELHHLPLADQDLLERADVDSHGHRQSSTGSAAP